MESDQLETGVTEPVKQKSWHQIAFEDLPDYSPFAERGPSTGKTVADFLNAKGVKPGEALLLEHEIVYWGKA